MPTIPLILIEGHMTIAMDSIQFLVHYLLQVDMVKWVKLNVMICTHVYLTSPLLSLHQL